MLKYIKTAGVILSLLFIAQTFAVDSDSKSAKCKKIMIEEGVSDDRLYTYALIGSTCSNLARVDVAVDFNNENIKDQYKKHNNNLTRNAKSDVGVIPVNITFNEPVTIEKAQSIIDAQNINLESYIIGVVDSTNKKHSFVEWPESDIISSEAQIQQKLAADQTAKGVLVITGFIDLRVANLDSMANDKSVYMVDLTASQLIQKLQKKYDLAITTVNLPSPYWDMNW
ncbi:hypothetical protein [Herpetosiphon gulosus]|uniref:Uncharacterized protein n=1 Tax=Herpetosiphon gulosus TaxID=1973496 RepID=A0ABP9WU13_9CHLR